MSPDLQKIIFVSLGCLWVTAIVSWEVKGKNWLGVLHCVVLIIAGVIWGLGDVYDFRGDLIALAFVFIWVIVFLATRQLVRSRSKRR